MKARLLALTAILFWSTAATAFKISLQYCSPYQLAMLASTVSLAALTVISMVSARKMEAAGPSGGSRPGLLAPAIRGLLNPFLYYMVLLEAYFRLPAQVAMVVNYLWPLMLVLLAIPVLKQKAGVWTLSATGICFSGVVVLAAGGRSIAGGVSPGAMGLALLSTIIWAGFWMMNLRSERGQVQSLLTGFAFGVLYLLAFGVITGGLPDLLRLPWQAYAGAAYIGLFEMGITFVIWLRALSLADSTADVGNLVYLTPFLALVFIGAATDEMISPWTVGGLILVSLGIVLQKWKGRVRAGP